MKVSIKDFQIVKSASLEFVPGLTVIQGESNNGKSALFRAIKSCIYNEPGTTNVRVGCKNYMVGIEHNNHKIILQKGENSLYVIDGEQYNKIGKSQVEEVRNALGISALSINGNTEKINFWDQMEKPFLLDRNSSDLFRFIVDSGEDDNLNTTLRSMVTDKNKLNVDKNLKEGSVTTLKEQIDEQDKLLAGFEGKIELCEKIISFGPRTSSLLTIKTNIEEIEETEIKLKETENTITELKITEKQLQDSMNTLSYRISSKQQLNDILNKEHNLSDIISQTSTALAGKLNLKDIIPQLDKNIMLVTKLADMVKKHAEISRILEDKVNRIEVKIDESKISKQNTLGLLLNRIDNVTTTSNSIKDELNKLHNDYADIIKEYNSVDICPYCNQRIIHNDTVKGGS